MAKLNLKDLPIKNRRILMRVDFNVPLENGVLRDDSKIKASLPSIQYVLSHGGSLILMSHLGRPKGKDPHLSLAPCAKRLSELLKKPVQMAPDCIGASMEALAHRLQPGEILLLENLRFHAGEEEPDKHPNFVAGLAKLGEAYVNDAFGTAHRAHASTASITKFFPEKSAMGFLMEKEIDALSPLLKNPEKPFYAILGGAKVSSKIGIIQRLLPLVDRFFIGGAMAFTFLKERGVPIGDSMSENSSLVRHLPKDQIVLPLDLTIAKSLSSGAKWKTVSIQEGISAGWQGVDIGPATVADWTQKLSEARTIFWNGPLGVFEIDSFAEGTRGVATALAEAPATTTIGGGDSVAAIEQMGLGKKFAHLSTGGGASLEFLELGRLPGIDALSDK